MQEIIALLNKHPDRDFHAEEISEGLLAEAGQCPPMSAMRLTLRSLAAAGDICMVEKAGQRNSYHSKRRGGAQNGAGGHGGAGVVGARSGSGGGGSVPPPAPGPRRGLSPAELLKEATAEPAHYGGRNGGAAAPYMDVIHTLKTDKRFSWKEISSWLAARGVTVGVATLCKSYAEWVKDPKRRGKE